MPIVRPEKPGQNRARFSEKARTTFAFLLSGLLLLSVRAAAQNIDEDALPAALQKQFQDYDAWRKTLGGAERERIETLDKLQHNFQKHVGLIYKVLPNVGLEERMLLLHALGFINVLEAKAHDAYLMEQMAIWTTEKPESKGMNKMALFPLYRTGLQIAKLLEDGDLTALAARNVDNKDYQGWISQLTSDLKVLQRTFWLRAHEIQPDAGPMFGKHPTG